MRISRDPDSWHADGVRRRDFRAAADGPDTPRRTPARKDTRRWCRGVVGREHTAERVPTGYRPVTFTVRDPLTGAAETVTKQVPTWWEVRCAACGTRRLPDHVRAQVDPAFARRRELAAQWCADGHLYDDVAVTTPTGRVYHRRACLMCDSPA